LPLQQSTIIVYPDSLDEAAFEITHPTDGKLHALACGRVSPQVAGVDAVKRDLEHDRVVICADMTSLEIGIRKGHRVEGVEELLNRPATTERLWQTIVVQNHVPRDVFGVVTR
jgi:hypothetical protein